MRHEDLENVAQNLGLNLQDKATFRETWDTVIRRALASKAEILPTLKNYDPNKNPNLTNDERAVAAHRLGEIQQEIQTADTQAKKDALLPEAGQMANLLYRSGSEAGRSLAFSKALIPDSLDAASVLTTAQAATDGKLSNTARQSLMNSVERAGKVREMTNQRVRTRGDAALDRLENFDFTTLTKKALEKC